MIIVNTKCYESGIGNNVLRIASIVERVKKETGIEIALACQSADISRIRDNYNINVYAQHVDFVNFGSHTGSIHVKSIVDAGACGSLINHSERRVKIDEIAGIVDILNNYGLKSIICASKPKIAGAIAFFKPYAIAIEPEELIGSGKAISKEKPDYIIDGLKAVRNVNKDVIFLCGAGIVNEEDVKRAIELGAQGILVASGVVKAVDVYNTLKTIALPFKKV